MEARKDLPMIPCPTDFRDIPAGNEDSAQPDERKEIQPVPLLARYGVLASTLLISGACTAVSAGIVFATVLWLDHPFFPDILLGTGIPILLAPPVAYLMAKFHELYEAAESSSKTKSEFLSNMSHDLQSPLHGIVGVTQMLLHDPTIKEKYQREITAIHASSQHLSELISEILDFGRIEAGVAEAEEENFHLHQTLVGLMDLFQIRCEFKGIRIELEVKPEVPGFVRGDRKKLRQVLVNVIGNALKFTNVGSIHVTVEMDSDQVLFRIADTGIGIAEAELKDIFVPFNHAGERFPKDGAGLGLAISLHYVDLMGGQLTVETKVDQGSTFTIRVPLREVSGTQGPKS